MTFTPLLILAGCRDAETSWLGGGKMPFMWLCKANILGVCKASVMLKLLEFQRVVFFFGKVAEVSRGKTETKLWLLSWISACPSSLIS